MLAPLWMGQEIKIQSEGEARSGSHGKTGAGQEPLFVSRQASVPLQIIAMSLAVYPAN